MEVLTDMRILKGMEKQGLIRFCRDTGKKVSVHFSDKRRIACYIEDGPTFFVYHKIKYQTKFVDGCFYPFVFIY